MPEHRLKRTRDAYREKMLTVDEQERIMRAYADAFWRAVQHPVVITDEGFTANVIEGNDH